eukprot:13306611-Alexandrium_andersonii.AAC.1
MDRVLSAAAALPAERFARRGPLLAQHMRSRKAVLRLERQGKLAPHVQSLVRVYNEDVAKTFSDVIDPMQRKPVQVKGPGLYRRWLPSALQRACWGLRPRQKFHRG